MPLADLNIAVPKLPLDAPQIADLMSALDRIDGLAQRMSGVIWIHKDEAKERLDHLGAHGDTEFAFGWSHLLHIKLWQAKRCG